MNRKIEIDRLKGLAILLVIMGHVYCKSLYIIDADSNVTFSLISMFHMPLFMFLSGLVVLDVPTTSKCLVKSIQFLCPAFFVGLLIVMFTHRTVDGMIASNMKYGYWYLYTLALYYWILALYWWIPNVKNTILGGAFFIVQSIILTILLHVFMEDIPANIADTLSLKQAGRYYPYFISGVFISRFKVIEIINRNTIVYTISILVILAALCFTWVMGFNQITSLHGITPVAIIILLLCVFIFRKDNNSVYETNLEKLGRKTLDIYIYHYFFVLSLHLQEFGGWFTKTSNFLLEFVFVTLISIGIAYLAILVGTLIRKSPLLNMIIYGQFLNYKDGKIEFLTQIKK